MDTYATLALIIPTSIGSATTNKEWRHPPANCGGRCLGMDSQQHPIFDDFPLNRCALCQRWPCSAVAEP